MSDGKLFCVYPWTHIFVSNSGRQFPCCYAQKFQGSTPHGPQIQEAADIDDLWNSEYLKTIRRDFDKGVFPKACLVCQKQESIKYESHRQKANQTFADLNYASARPDGRLDSPVRTADFRIGNVCNLKCRMCDPASSNQLVKEWLESGDPEMIEDAKSIARRPPWSASESGMKLLESPRVELERIFFAGGEPSVEPNHKKFLSWVLEKGYASKLEVTYNTNLVKPLFILEHLAEFKGVQVCASIDGIGALNDYIRAPSRWPEIEGHFIALLNLRRRHKNLNVTVNMTLQAYNILRVAELYGYFAALGKTYGPIDLFFDFVASPEYLSPLILPLSLQRRAVETMDREAGDLKFASEESRGFAEHQLAEIRKYLISGFGGPEQERRRLFLQFQEHTRRMDRARGQDVLSVMPELQPYWESCEFRRL